MTRIVDLAKMLNVAPSTISKALNNKPGVNPELRKKIVEVAEKLGYRRNPMAIYLKTKKSKVIGLVIPNVSNYFFGKLVLSIEKCLYERGYQYILSNTDENEEKEMEYLQTYSTYDVGGIISVTALVTMKRKMVQAYNSFLISGKPVVFVDRIIKGLNASYVVLDNTGAAFEAVEYLVKNGHRRIGVIIGPKGVYTSEKRLEGFLKAVNTFGIDFREDWMVKGEFSLKTSYENVLNAFSNLKEIPTALVALNNMMAMGALEAFKELGIKVPEDVSILTFDDMPWHKFFDPPLTSISQPIEEMSILSASILLEEMRNPHKKKRAVVLKGKLVERGSVLNIK